LLILEATRKDIDTAIAIFEELGSRLEFGGMSVVVHASRVPGVRAAFPSTVIPSFPGPLRADKTNDDNAKSCSV